MSSPSSSVNDSVATLVQLSVAEDSPIEYVVLDGDIYSCKDCKTHLALSDDVVSKEFHCKNGRAYLFSKCKCDGWGQGRKNHDDRGVHIVADIYCVKCGTIVGWTYETAVEKKGNLSLNGLRFLVLMEAMIRLVEAHVGGNDQDHV